MVDQERQDDEHVTEGGSEPGLSAGTGRVRRFARRRQANESGGRAHSHRVKVTDVEAAALAQRADELGVSVPRLLVEAALADPARSATSAQRQEAMVELFAVRRLLAAVSNNVNQVARHANSTGELPAEAAATVAAARRVADRIDGVIDELSDAGPRRARATSSAAEVDEERVMSRAREDAAAAVAGDAGDELSRRTSPEPSRSAAAEPSRTADAERWQQWAVTGR